MLPRAAESRREGKRAEVVPDLCPRPLSKRGLPAFADSLFTLPRVRSDGGAAEVRWPSTGLLKNWLIVQRPPAVSLPPGPFMHWNGDLLRWLFKIRISGLAAVASEKEVLCNRLFTF